MQNPIVSREEAKRMGFTHEGTMLGIPVWVINLEELDTFRWMAKFEWFGPVLNFIGKYFDIECYVHGEI